MKIADITKTAAPVTVLTEAQDRVQVFETAHPTVQGVPVDDFTAYLDALTVVNESRGE